MDRLRGSGFLWLIAALVAIATTLAFRDDQLQIVLTLVGGAIALGVGAWMLLRASGMAIKVSTILGVAWVVLFGALAAIQAADPAALVTDFGIAVFGGVAALLAYRTGVASASGRRGS
jgi:uncharacterized membrane protein